MYEHENLKEEFLTREQVSELCHVSTTTVYRWDKEGKIKPYGIGVKALYKRNDIMNLILGK
tara:strand:+ start:2051 stop:2233 length:183 start_codon:yes stop_codon:yes gene_type:complete